MEPIAVDPFKLGPTAETPYNLQGTPRAEFQEPRPKLSIRLTPLASTQSNEVYNTGLYATVEGTPGPSERILMYVALTHLQEDLAKLSQNINTQIIYMDTCIKALIQKLD